MGISASDTVLILALGATKNEADLLCKGHTVPNH